MSLAQPDILLCKGAALPAGTPRTLIVIGPARGGTTMLAQMVRDLGIFMGDLLDPMGQDLTVSEFSRALHGGAIDIADPAIERFLRQRDRDHAIWGWKFPERIFPEFYAKARNPHVIAVFRDPVAIASREAVSQGYNVDRCFERALEQIAELGRFLAETAYPCLIVSYERALARPAELVDALADFAGVDVPPDMRRAAAQRARPGSREYLMGSRAPEIEGYIDRVGPTITGWLRYPHQGNRRVAFGVLLDGVRVWEGNAERFRKDLVRFANDGCSAFDIPIPPRFKDGKAHRVVIRVADELSFSFINNNDREWVIMPATAP